MYVKKKHYYRAMQAVQNDIKFKSYLSCVKKHPKDPANSKRIFRDK